MPLNMYNFWVKNGKIFTISNLFLAIFLLQALASNHNIKGFKKSSPSRSALLPNLATSCS